MFVFSCDEGWGGNNTCNEPNVPLYSHLQDDFTNGPYREIWSAVHGGVADTQCDVLASGPSLHFTGVSKKLDYSIRHYMICVYIDI